MTLVFSHENVMTLVFSHENVMTLVFSHENAKIDWIWVYFGGAAQHHIYICPLLASITVIALPPVFHDTSLPQHQEHDAGACIACWTRNCAKSTG